MYKPKKISQFSIRSDSSVGIVLRSLFHCYGPGFNSWSLHFLFQLREKITWPDGPENSHMTPELKGFPLEHKILALLFSKAVHNTIPMFYKNAEHKIDPWCFLSNIFSLSQLKKKVKWPGIELGALAVNQRPKHYTNWAIRPDWKIWNFLGFIDIMSAFVPLLGF